MWKRYLGPHAKIIGVDIDPGCKALEEDQIEIRIGNQSDPHFLQSIVDEFGPFDVVLDDGSHRMEDVRASFNFLYDHVCRNGIYLVEDLHTAYWDEYGGGLRRPGTFIEHCKDLIDDLNADWSRGLLQPSVFTRTTMAMHFYDSICVFEKGRNLNKAAPMIGRADAGPMTELEPLPDWATGKVPHIPT